MAPHCVLAHSRRDLGLLRPETTVATTVAAAAFPAHSGTNPLLLQQHHHQCESCQYESRHWGQTGLDSPDLCRTHYRYGRRRKSTLSIVPSSSLSNFLSGLEGLSADTRNSYHYLHWPPPLSAVSGVPAACSPISCRRPGWLGGCWGRNEPGGAAEGGGGCMRAPRPTCHTRSGWRISHGGCRGSTTHNNTTHTTRWFR